MTQPRGKGGHRLPAVYFWPNGDVLKQKDNNEEKLEPPALTKQGFPKRNGSASPKSRKAVPTSGGPCFKVHAASPRGALLRRPVWGSREASPQAGVDGQAAGGGCGCETGGTSVVLGVRGAPGRPRVAPLGPL